MQRASPRPPATMVGILLFCITFLAFIFSRTSFSVARFVATFGFSSGKIISPDEWYRVITSTMIHENAIFLLITILFLSILGGPFENRQGTVHFLKIFCGASLVAFGVFSALTWGQDISFTGAFAGIGGIVGAWTIEAYGRKRVSYYKSVIMRDFEELPGFLVLALWVFTIFIVTVLFIGDIVSYFSAICAATLAGAVIHLAFTKGRAKLSI
jgi:membrane associated rhomboid family serine protease